MLRAAVVEVLSGVLGEELGRDELPRFLSDPPTPEQGDVAFGCFGLAKLRRKPPAAVAIELAQELGARGFAPDGLLRSVEAAGPYLNFRASPSALLDRVCRSVAAGRLLDDAVSPTPQRVMIEFSQPNTHKPFHVGHLRNVALGDSLVRINRALGHTVVAANYFGDFGIDVAKCLWWLDTHPDLVPPADGRTSWLGAAYIAANDAIKPGKNDDPETRAERGRLLDAVRALLHDMETQTEPVWGKYRETRQWCLDEFAELYAWLDVAFDVVFYESEVEEAGSAVVSDCLARGVFEMSDGAVVCRLEPEIEVPALVRKRDGTSLYLTWDLALAKRKFDEHAIERSIYVVGSEQRFHFQQLFATLRKMGYARAADCRHVAYELVVLPEGKMSSRDGTAVPLHVLRAAVEAATAERTAIPPGANRDEVVHRVGVACLKYGMLRIGVNKRVVFSLDDWTNPEGDTGAYLLYGLARIRSIVRRAHAELGVQVDLGDGVQPGSAFGEAAAERGLLSHLLALPGAVERAAAGDDPSTLAGWAYDAARAYSRFHHECPVLKAEPDLLRARLALIQATDAALTLGLHLLGITPLDAM